MASNPMQKKARNSFLLGMIITLLIVALIGAALYFMVIRPKQIAEKEQEGAKRNIYVLNQDINEKQMITSDAFIIVKDVPESMIPTNYVDPDLLAIMEVRDSENHIFQSENGQNFYETKSGSGYKTIASNSSKKTNSDTEKVLISTDEETGEYYRTTLAGEKEYIEFTSKPYAAKVNLTANTVLTTSLMQNYGGIENDLRSVEYNMLSLPTTAMIGDTVDIRLTLPNGQDFIVVAKKEIKSLLGNTVGFDLTEGEILMMESAIVESYIMSASKLYVVKYVQAENQEEAQKTYVPTDAVRQLIDIDSNILQRAKNALKARFDDGLRGTINNEVGSYVMEADTNLKEKMQKEIQNAKAAREAYLSGLTSYETN